MRSMLISTKPFIFVLFLVGVTVRSVESLSSAIPLGTSTKRANSKRANHGRSSLFQGVVPSVSFWLQLFPVREWRTRSLSSVSGLPTRWRCVRGWLMRLLWAYEHFLSERIGTFCGHQCWFLWLEQRTTGWSSGRSEGNSKSLSAGYVPTDLLLLMQRICPIRFPGDFAGPYRRAPSISFGAHPRIGCWLQHRGLSLCPLRMKVWWGCPPRVLSPPPHRTQSWRPCLRGHPWVSGWRSTDHPVPNPCGWMIGFSERGVAHNRVLLQCLFSRRCMRSWRSRGWPLSWPEAARPSPPSSLPSMAGLPGGTRAFPRWRERSRCTCAHETPPLGGTAHVSCPKPVSWQPLSRPKLIVLRARQPLPCTPWLSCRFTKPRHSNRCTRVVPTRG